MAEEKKAIPSWITDNESYSAKSNAKAVFKKKSTTSNFLITIVYNCGSKDLRANPNLRLRIYNAFQTIMPKYKRALETKVILKPFGKTQLAKCQLTGFDWTCEKAPNKGRIHIHAIAVFNGTCHIQIEKSRIALNTEFQRAFPEMDTTNNLHYNIKPYKDTKKILDYYITKQRENEPEEDIELGGDSDPEESEEEEEDNGDEPSMR